MKLLSTTDLEQSTVVANNRMNRERGFIGVNSYQKDLGIDLVQFFHNRIARGRPVSWLDICCGQGRALIEASQYAMEQQWQGMLTIEGIDLVGMFDAFDPQSHPNLSLIEASIFDWKAKRSYDLITSVHGLHYLGDKLLCIRYAAQQLKEDGQLLAHLDPNNVIDETHSSIWRQLVKSWKGLGCEFHDRKGLLSIQGRQELPDHWEYLGADDQAGPNHTGQEAVNSYYQSKATSA
ncbi:MAG: methyltransferase domain-containing protein [Bacteroidota bacterium]